MLKKALNSIKTVYSPEFPRTITYMLQSSDYKIWAYLKWFWRTQYFSEVRKGHELDESAITTAILGSLYAGIVVQVIIGIVLMFLNIGDHVVAGLEYGLAVVISYPLVWAHLLPIIALLTGAKRIPSPKKFGKAFLCKILESQVKQLRAKHQFKVIAVVGSVGKTSTKLAIAKTLQTSGRVQYQEGNYNDRLTVPLVIFGQNLPNLFNLVAWAKIIKANRRLIQDYPYDFVVAELGTDTPGDIAEFAYLKPELAVVTAITPEHMEYFKTLDAVAKEELAIFKFAKQVLINISDAPSEYLKDQTFVSYGLEKSADYSLKEDRHQNLTGSDLTVELKGKQLKAHSGVIGKQGALIALAAAATCDLLALAADDIAKGLSNIKPFAGRMQILKGLKNSIIIDDTYNASPAAVIAGLDVLYMAQGTQRIAILGSMNELGDYSAEAHKEVGNYCQPEKLDLVITIGKDAEKYLAPVAKKTGCQVKSFKSPYKAGQFVRDELKSGAVILGEGSQNGVFAEEAIKQLLADSADQNQLVRQSKYWMKIKARQFANV